MTCLAMGATLLALATPAFTLSWTHSVEHVDWQEDWRVDRDRLSLVAARIRGSGAGMEPGDGAELVDGWWQWPGNLDVPSLTLAASGATGSGWTFCADGTCRELGGTSGAPITLMPCPDG